MFVVCSNTWAMFGYPDILVHLDFEINDIVCEGGGGGSGENTRPPRSKQRVGMRVHWVKSLLRKHKDPSLEPRHILGHGTE